MYIHEFTLALSTVKLKLKTILILTFQLSAKYPDEKLVDRITLPGIPFINVTLLGNDRSFTLQTIKP